MEEWQEKDHQQQSFLLDKQEDIDKLGKMVDNLECQLSAKINRYVQWELFDTCVAVEVVGGSGGLDCILNWTHSLS